MSVVKCTVFRGEPENFADFHRDGRPVFFTDNEQEALSYGPSIIEAKLNVGKMFEPGNLVARINGDWVADRKVGSDPVESETFLQALAERYPTDRVEAIYYHVEGGSWSEVERPEIQSWLRQAGYDGFICWEGDGMTYAVFNPDNVEVLQRTMQRPPGAR